MLKTKWNKRYMYRLKHIRAIDILMRNATLPLPFKLEVRQMIGWLRRNGYEEAWRALSALSGWSDLAH